MAGHRSSRRMRLGILLLSLWAAGLCHGLRAAEKKTSAKANPPAGTIQFTPGKAVHVKIPGTKTVDEHFVVYVPADYTADESWPTIFWFHGLNGRPTVDLIRRITDGKHFVLVGVAYHMRGMEGYDHYKRDIENLKIIVPYLERSLKLQRGLFFVGGFSKGAFYADRMMCASPRTWAGALLLGGGKDSVSARDHAALRGKPVFIGCGDQDVHLKSAEKGTGTTPNTARRLRSRPGPVWGIAARPIPRP